MTDWTMTADVVMINSSSFSIEICDDVRSCLMNKSQESEKKLKL
jgi:hypothetical protein